MSLFGLFGKKKDKPAMQPATTQSTTPAPTLTEPPATQASPTPSPVTPPVIQPAEEPKKMPEVKTLDTKEETEKISGSLRPENLPHVFVIMPFGKKKGADG